MNPTGSRQGTALPAPMLPTLADAPFDSNEWLFELKWDGIRAVCSVEKGKVIAASRTGRDLTGQFPELLALAQSFRRLPVIVDGEIVSLDDGGLPSFQRLQPRMNRRISATGPYPAVTFVVFDLLGVGGRDLRATPLDERKSALARIVRDKSIVMYSKDVVGTGTRLFAHASRLGFEGIVAKRRASCYRSGRSRDWLKIKSVCRQEFVIGGWTEPRRGRRHLGALLVGYFDGGRLTYAGHVGTGFNESTLGGLARVLRPLASRTCPFSKAPKTNSDAHWVRPMLVAEVKFGEWTRDGMLRVPVYLGLRADKKPEECVREQPAVRTHARKR